MKTTALVFTLLVTVDGIAALSWELLWQMQASLALGVSAQGTAITLAATMGGMACGALLSGKLLRGREVVSPVRVYSLLELVIGLSGLVMLPGFRMLELIDGALFAHSPLMTPSVHLKNPGRWISSS